MKALKITYETIRLAAIFGLITYALFAILYVSTPQAPQSSEIEI